MLPGRARQKITTDHTGSVQSSTHSLILIKKNISLLIWLLRFDILMIGSYCFTITVNLKLRPTNQRVKVIQQKKYNRGWHFELKQEYLNITSSSLTKQERRERNPPTWAPVSPVLPPPALISVTIGIYGAVFNKISLVDHSSLSLSSSYYLFAYFMARLSFTLYRLNLHPNNICCELKTLQWAGTVMSSKNNFFTRKCWSGWYEGNEGKQKAKLIKICQ